jgi:hypothetical protein
MRACASTHLFQETAEDAYAHNPFSMIFTDPSNRDIFKLIYDFTGKAVYEFPGFLAKNNWKYPIDYHNSAFHYAHNTKLGFWDYLQDDPERMRALNSGMRSSVAIGEYPGPYPFGLELGHDNGDDKVLLVDCGGGRGQALEAIKSMYPELRGRMILQDRRDVILGAKAQGLPAFIEPQIASLFEPQTVQGTSPVQTRLIAPPFESRL